MRIPLLFGLILASLLGTASASDAFFGLFRRPNVQVNVINPPVLAPKFTDATGNAGASTNNGFYQQRNFPQRNFQRNFPNRFNGPGGNCAPSGQFQFRGR